MTFPRTRFDWPLLAFLLSAVWGAGVAFDGAGAARALAFIGAGVALYYVLALAPSHVAWGAADLPLLRLVIGAIPAFVAAYFVLTNDWTQPVEKAGWLEPIRTWLAGVQPRVGWPRLHPNVVGGALAMLLPLQVAALLSRRQAEGVRTRGSRLSPPAILLLGLSCAGLLLSGLRGAWAALAVAAALALWWRVSGRRCRGRRAWIRGAVWAGAVGAIVVVLVSTSLGASALALRQDRVQVWQNSWDLAWDYAFTGVGLGAFSMAYSSYVLLLHVPHTAHAHNLLLDVWLAQGLAGVLAFTWLLVTAFRPLVTGPAAPASSSGHACRWRAAAWISLLVILVHGLWDDVYYGHGGAGALLLFVPFALLARRSGGAPRGDVGAWRVGRLAAGGAAAVVIAVMAALPASRAQFEANLGTLLQTSAELSVYRWPQWPVQDAVRRSHAVNLDSAARHFEAALAIDPANVTANRRLGQIELSQGKYGDAQRHLGAAYRVAPGQHATRLLFGESLAVTGEVAAAAGVWRSLSTGRDQLAVRRHWYDSLKDARRAQWVGDAIELAKQ